MTLNEQRTLYLDSLKLRFLPDQERFFGLQANRVYKRGDEGGQNLGQYDRGKIEGL